MRFKSRLFQVCLLSATLLIGGTAIANKGQNTLLAQAASAWEEADLEKSAQLYEKALKKGGLYPSDVVVAYVRIGTVHAAQGNNDAAMSAFRVAAALDPSFELPPEAGPKAKKVFKKASEEAVQQGGKLTITMESPDTSEAGMEFIVTAYMDEAFAPLVIDVGVTVQDPSVATSSVKPWSTKKQADTEVSFEIPGKVVIGGSNLLVRVDALDSYGNRWASSQARVRVRGAPPIEHDAEREGSLPKDEKESKEGGFWSSPWTWVIGGAVLAGAGVGAYFLFRPPSERPVGAPVWRLEAP